MNSILDDPPGDRTAIVAAYADGNERNTEALLRAYTNWTDTEIRKCEKRAGAREILRQLSTHGIGVYVNSATPTVHLVPAVQTHFGDFQFAGIFGGHGRKSENLRSILESEQLKPTEILVVGDGIDDHACATNVGTTFCGVDGGSLVVDLPSIPVLQDLSEISRKFALRKSART
jgi:phosphoglycolate phosphatase-like HAD superfamily hydrolase